MFEKICKPTFQSHTGNQAAPVYPHFKGKGYAEQQPNQCLQHSQTVLNSSVLCSALFMFGTVKAMQSARLLRIDDRWAGGWGCWSWLASTTEQNLCGTMDTARKHSIWDWSLQWLQSPLPHQGLHSWDGKTNPDTHVEHTQVTQLLFFLNRRVVPPGTPSSGVCQKSCLKA